MFSKILKLKRRRTKHVSFPKWSWCEGFTRMPPVRDKDPYSKHSASVTEGHMFTCTRPNSILLRSRIINTCLASTARTLTKTQIPHSIKSNVNNSWHPEEPFQKLWRSGCTQDAYLYPSPHYGKALLPNEGIRKWGVRQWLLDVAKLHYILHPIPRLLLSYINYRGTFVTTKEVIGILLFTPRTLLVFHSCSVNVLLRFQDPI